MSRLLTAPDTRTLPEQAGKHVTAVHEHASCLPPQTLPAGTSTRFGGTPVGFHGHAVCDDDEHGRPLNARRPGTVYPSLTATTHLSTIRVP